MRQTDVITVGFGHEPACNSIASQIKNLGFALTAAENPNRLRELMSRQQVRTVVVYSPREECAAQETLAVLDEQGRSPRVIVLVDEADFGHYYELMGSGASNYYEVSEGPEAIALAIQQASRT